MYCVWGRFRASLDPCDNRARPAISLGVHNSRASPTCMGARTVRTNRSMVLP